MMTLSSPPLAELLALPYGPTGPLLPAGVSQDMCYRFKDSLGMPPPSTLARMRRSGECRCRTDRGPPHDEATDAPVPVAAGALPVAGSDTSVAGWLVAEPNDFYDVGMHIIGLKNLTDAGHRGFVALDDGQYLLVEYVAFEDLSAFHDRMKAWYRADIPSAERAGQDREPNDSRDGLDILRKELAAGRGSGAGGPAGVFVDSDEADQRVLAVCRNLRGHRFLDFKLSVERMTQVDSADWPLTGPRTLLGG